MNERPGSQGVEVSRDHSFIYLSQYIERSSLNIFCNFNLIKCPLEKTKNQSDYQGHIDIDNF